MSCIEKKTTYSIDTRIKFQNTVIIDFGTENIIL